MSYLSECCQAAVDTDIMICSECHEHLGDEDIYEEASEEADAESRTIEE